MNLKPLCRSVVVALFAASAMIPTMHVSAAIPCQTMDMIEPDPNMVIPMIYIELPVTLEGALSRGQAADRTGSEPAGDAAGGVTMAAENQFRCLGYGDSVAFASNSTPQQRVNMWAVPGVDTETEYIKVENVYLEHLDEPILLADGRYLVDFGIIVDGDQYLHGELVFLQTDAGFYLDGSAIDNSVELLPEPVVMELRLNSTREVKIINVTHGDTLVFDNQEDEASANITITDGDGEVIFEGFDMANLMVGGEDVDRFVIQGLEPGEYTITIVFDQDDITYSATLVVNGDGSATPMASPAATPAP